MKVCNQCGDKKKLSQFYKHPLTKDKRHPTCMVCVRARSKAWPSRNREHRRRAELESHLVGKYGLPLVAYERMQEAQEGRCAICNEEPSGRFSRLCVDHDHRTGEVRALLCDRCNRGLGQFKDSVELMRLAIEYLENHGTA